MNACNCKPGRERDNCPNCEGTGRAIDFKTLRETPATPAAAAPTLAAKLGVATSNRSRLVVSVELIDGRLSFSGSLDTIDGGGSGGQIVEHLEADAEQIAGEPGGRRGIGPADLSRLVELWRRWHLNDMRPGCEHQTGAAWDVTREVEHRTYSIEWDDRRDLERQTEKDAAALTSKALDTSAPTFGGPNLRSYSHAAALLWTLQAAGVKPFHWQAVSGRALAVLSQSFEIVTAAELGAYREQAARSAQGLDWKWKGRLHWSHAAGAKPPVIVKIEHKALGWLRPSEHPDGLLCKPCAVCGYEYGTRWLREEIPAAVVEELRRIVSDRTPPPSPDAMLERLGFALECEPIPARTDGATHGARHFRCTLSRGRRRFSFEFSQGSAHTEPPTLADVFDCLRADAALAQDEAEAEACGVKLADWPKLKRSAQQFRAVVGDAAEQVGVS